MDMDYETIRAEAKAAETRAIRTEKLKYLSISVAVVLLVLLLWQLASMGLQQEILLASPVSVAGKHPLFCLSTGCGGDHSQQDHG